MKKHRFRSMSTMIEVSYCETIFPFQIDEIIDYFSLIERICSRFRKDSELSLINNQVGQEQPVSDLLLDILQAALLFYNETDGLFNPGILDALENQGYLESIEKVIEGTSVKRESKKTNFVPYILNAEKRTVTLHTRIDLGGIAKSWAVDKAAEMLDPFGYGYVNAGGDIRIFGKLPRPLRIGVEDPFNPINNLTVIEVESGGVATSSTIKRRWEANGNWHHHLIDPQTGESSNGDIVSSTLTAASCVEADVWAKSILLLGEEQGVQMVKQRKSKAVLINSNGLLVKGS